MAKLWQKKKKFNLSSFNFTMVLLVPKIRVVGMYIPETRDPGMYVPTTRVLGTHSTTNAADDRIQDMGNNLDE